MTIDSSKPIIELKDVQVCYGDVCVLDIRDVVIMPGERVFVLGKSGSGKTTLSRLLKGRARASRGTVKVFGVEQARPRQYGAAAPPTPPDRATGMSTGAVAPAAGASARDTA